MSSKKTGKITSFSEFPTRKRKVSPNGRDPSIPNPPNPNTNYKKQFNEHLKSFIVERNTKKNMIPDNAWKELETKKKRRFISKKLYPADTGPEIEAQLNALENAGIKDRKPGKNPNYWGGKTKKRRKQKKKRK